MSNTGDITTSFKQVFISQKNSGYIFELIITRLLNSQPEYRDIVMTHIQTYRTNLLEIQNYIFNDLFTKLYNDGLKSGNVDLEDILISLNKVTVTKFETIIGRDLHSKYEQLAQAREQQQLQAQQQAREQLAQAKAREQQQLAQVREQEKAREREQLAQAQQQAQQREQLTQAQQQARERDVNNTSNNNRSQKANNERNKHQKVKIDIIKGEETNAKVVYKHYFSKDGIYKSGKFYFNTNIEKVKCLSVRSIKIICNMYNINENNNKFYIIQNQNSTPETEQSILITIPVGYYTIEELTSTIEKLLSEYVVCKISRNTIQNKVYILIRDVSNVSYLGFKFIKNKDNVSLGEILGFTKEKYTTIEDEYISGLFISEKMPLENIYDNLFFQMYINDRELQKYTTSNNKFGYYECLNLDYNSNFGQSVNFSSDYIEPYDIHENINVKSVAFEIKNDLKYTLDNIHFEVILGFESMNLK